MAIVRFDPFRDFAILQDRMHRLFTEGTWPPVDIYEAEGRLVLKAEVPDMRREDIDVTVENGTLSIRGERTLDGDVKQDAFHRLERTYGRFARTFSLPPTVDAGRISAEYKNGVLTVTLPIREEAKPRTVKIEVAA